jgi:hypothetical protein
MSDGTLKLDVPALSARWLGEPLLAFAHGIAHPDPKVGIPYAGPSSLGTFRHRDVVKVGLVGTGEGVEVVRAFLESAADGVDGDESHHPFPGFRSDRGFRTELRLDDANTATITAAEQRSILESGKGQRERFEELLDTLDDRVRNLVNAETPVDLILVVLPYDVARRCGTADYLEHGDLVHRDLHAAFKARCMQYRMPTQMIWESASGLADYHDTDHTHKADVAWDIFTALYFKADGCPWSPAGLPGGTCFVGIDFYQPPGDSSVRASLAQVFTETGDAFVLQGAPIPGVRPGRSRHLDAEEAGTLITTVRQRYERYFLRQPVHVVVHKRTPFTEAERAGFQDALSDIKFDLAAVRPSDHMRLLRNGEYPPHRGTLYRFGQESYLYTTGTLAVTGLHPNEHLSEPLRVSDHVGHSSYDQLLNDILMLTKMNWNSARYAEQMPVTLQFADRVGDVLRETGPDCQPEAKYAYYM